MDENKKRALAAALGQIEKQFGKGAVMRMGDHDDHAHGGDDHGLDAEDNHDDGH